MIMTLVEKKGSMTLVDHDTLGGTTCAQKYSEFQFKTDIVNLKCIVLLNFYVDLHTRHLDMLMNIYLILQIDVHVIFWILEIYFRLKSMNSLYLELNSFHISRQDIYKSPQTSIALPAFFIWNALPEFWKGFSNISIFVHFTKIMYQNVSLL